MLLNYQEIFFVTKYFLSADNNNFSDFEVLTLQLLALVKFHMSVSLVSRVLCDQQFHMQLVSFYLATKSVYLTVEIFL